MVTYLRVLDFEFVTHIIIIIIIIVFIIFIASTSADATQGIAAAVRNGVRSTPHGNDAVGQAVVVAAPRAWRTARLCEHRRNGDCERPRGDHERGTGLHDFRRDGCTQMYRASTTL